MIIYFAGSFRLELLVDAFAEMEKQELPFGLLFSFLETDDIEKCLKQQAQTKKRRRKK